MKKLLVILMGVIMTVSFSACSMQSAVDSKEETANTGESDAKKEEDEEYLFVLILPETESEAIQYTIDTVGGQIEALGYEVMIGSYQNDASKIASVVENFDVAGVDVALVNPYTEADAESTSQLLEEAGIKNVIVGIQASVYDVFLTLDQVQYGADLATLACDWIEETYGDERVEVAILTMSQTQNVHERSFGIRDMLKERCPNAEIVAEADASNAEDSIAATENLFTKHPDIKCVICVKDDFSIGAIEAFKGAGKTGDEYAVFGMDFNEQVGNELLKSDSVYRGSAYIDGSKVNCGEIMLQALTGELEKGTDIVYPTALVTSENAKEALIEHNYTVEE